MTRNRDVIRVDQPTPCTIDINREVFEQIIDITVCPGGSKSAEKLVSLQRAAKRICGGCPAVAQCFAVHGDDFRLGVVAGATDQERADFFGEATA